jgi:hypothetical protein
MIYINEILNKLTVPSNDDDNFFVRQSTFKDIKNSPNLVKFYICKPKSTGRGSFIRKQTVLF